MSKASASSSEFPGWHGTTIVAVRKGNKVVIAGDGQVSVGRTVLKHKARKVRRLVGDRVIGCFAGSTADAFTGVSRRGHKNKHYTDPRLPTHTHPRNTAAHNS